LEGNIITNGGPQRTIARTFDLTLTLTFKGRDTM
jgi:hypothetical protein